MKFVHFMTCELQLLELSQAHNSPQHLYDTPFKLLERSSQMVFISAEFELAEKRWFGFPHLHHFF